MRYLGINLSEEEKDLYIGEYKTFLKKIKDNINGKIFHTHELED